MNSISLEDDQTANTKLKQEDINTLKEWHSKQPHLPKVKDSDYALFLHKHYYADMDMSKVTLDKFFTLRTHSPEFFRNRDPVNSHVIHQGFKTISVLPLEKRTRKNFKVILMRLVDTDPENYDFNSTITYMNAVMDVCLLEEGTCKGMCRGYMFLFDLNGFKLEHVKRLTWMGLKKVVDYYMDGVPIRWISAHFVDSNRNCSDPHAWNLMESHITDLEISDLSYFHKTMEALNRFIPLDILPNEMGGSAGALMDLHNAQLKKLESYRDWLMMTETNFLVNESLRPKKPSTMQDVFGLERRFTACAEDV